MTTNCVQYVESVGLVDRQMDRSINQYDYHLATLLLEAKGETKGHERRMRGRLTVG